MQIFGSLQVLLQFDISNILITACEKSKLEIAFQHFSSKSLQQESDRNEPSVDLFKIQTLMGLIQDQWGEMGYGYIKSRLNKIFRQTVLCLIWHHLPRHYARVQEAVSSLLEMKFGGRCSPAEGYGVWRACPRSAIRIQELIGI